MPHLLEIVRAADGSGPLFRVTPQGRPAVEGPTASKAWQALYACDASGQARSLGLSGGWHATVLAGRVAAAAPPGWSQRAGGTGRPAYVVKEA